MPVSLHPPCQFAEQELPSQLQTSITMQNLNPFSLNKTSPYRRLSKEFSEDDSVQGHTSGTSSTSSTSSTLAPKESYVDEDDYLIPKELVRPRRSRWKQSCCYGAVAVLSLLVGLVFGEIFRLEYEIDGYIGTIDDSISRLLDTGVAILITRSAIRQCPPHGQRRSLATKRHIRPGAQRSYGESLG